MTGTETASTATKGSPPDLVARFAGALEPLRPGSGRIGLAVSGGPDSMAMLLLAHAAVAGEFEVATVDHGLRREARDECALVEQACAMRSILCAVLRVAVNKGNLQEQARRARYAALAGWAGERGLSAIATAHHADDQAETLLMRLNRGSGVAGLAGVRDSVSTAGPAGSLPVIRPLLGFRRAELKRVIAAAGVKVAHDPSNVDERFDRVRVRKMLANADWLDVPAMARSAAHLADADEALESFADLLQSDHVRREAEAIHIVPGMPRAVALRIVGRVLAELGASNTRGSELGRLLARLEAGEGGNLGGVLARVEGGEWVFRPEPPRRTL